MELEVSIESKTDIHVGVVCIKTLSLGVGVRTPMGHGASRKKSGARDHDPPHLWERAGYWYSQTGWNAVEVRKYEEGTQDATEPALKKAEMVGRAVATIVESRQETRMQSESPKNTAMTFLRGSRFVWSVRETVSECGSATVVASSWTMIDTSGVTDRGVDTAVPG